MRPWAWLAAMIAVCLVLASSTALYAINSDVRLDLPWWTAVVAPVLVYALVLPLCVRRIRVGGWLIGFVVLAALHLALGLATALLYAQVSFSSIAETLAPAFWAFPPAVVLEMVGALLVTLPFLGSLAPRVAAPRAPAERVMAEAGAGREKFDLSALPGTTRESWARTAAMKEPAVPPTAAATQSADPPPATAIVQEVWEPPFPVPAEPTVHVVPLAGKNGSPVEAVPHVTEVAPPEDFRDAVRELLGSRVAPLNAHVEEPKPPVSLVPEEPASELTAEAPAWAKAVKTGPPLATESSRLETSAGAKMAEPAPPTAPEPSKPGPAAAVRIPFDRVVGQLPPGAFRVPLPQLGARLREPETLLVAHSLIVPQLGEGVVQVPWEEVAEQFPAGVLAVPLAEVKERIVNGRLLLPLDEIVRQLSPDVFGALLGRGPVEVPGIESFPAPFKPLGGSAPLAPPPAASRVAEPVSHVEPATIEVPSDAQVPADPAHNAISAPVEAAVAYEEAPAPLPPAPAVVEPPAKLEETVEPPVPLPARVVEAMREPVVESPARAAPTPTLDGEQVRIPFERVLAQLPPGAFRVALDEVGARLAEPGVLLVPQALVVSQLAEGAVYAKWETVAAQFPSALLAVDPADVREHLEEARLSLPLDEIIRQLPPDVFGAAMARGPVHVPGIENFPAPFKPFQPEKPPAAEPPVVDTVSAPAPSVAEPQPSHVSLSSSEIPVVEVARPEPTRAPSPAAPPAEFTALAPPTRWPTPVVGVSPPAAPVAVEAPEPVMESAATEIAPPPVMPMINVPIVEPSAPVGQTRPSPPAPFLPSQAVADSGTAAESSARETQRAVPDAAEPLEAEPHQKHMTTYADGAEPVSRETPTPNPSVPLAASEGEPALAKDAVVVEPPAPFPAMKDIPPVKAPVREAAVPVPPASVLEPPAPLEPRDLLSLTPRVSAPVPTKERLGPVSPSSQPVPVAPLYEARVFERPMTVEPASGPSARPEHLEKIAALMGPLATVAPVETRVGDFTIVSGSTAGMAASTVTAAAGRLCPIMARGMSQPIEQVTLRGAGGMLVLTPLGSSWSGGVMLAVGMRTGGALARLEMLARRAAASPVDREPLRGTAVFARFDRTVTPPAIAAAAEDLTSFGPLDVQSYREAASGAVVRCLVAPGLSAPELAPFAWELAQVMAQSVPAEALGAFHSAVLRSGKTRVEIRMLPAPAGLPQILVVAGGDTGRPGLARLQVERTAARLSEA